MPRLESQDGRAEVSARASSDEEGGGSTADRSDDLPSRHGTLPAWPTQKSTVGDAAAATRLTVIPKQTGTILGLTPIDWQLVTMILAIKALIFTFGVQSYLVWMDQRPAGLLGWLEIWNRWDGLHYLKIAQYGYSATGELRLTLNFYPLFPWTVRLCALIIGNYLLSAFIVSTLASIAAGILLQRLVQLDHSAAIARRAVWYLFIFPTSYFLHIGYTESLFLMLVLGCLLAARTQRWLLAGVLGALAGLTRGPGLVLIPTLCAEALHQYWTTRRWQWQWLWIVVAACGFGGYLLLNTRVADNPFAFMSIAREHFGVSLSWPWEGIRAAIEAKNLRPAEAEMVGVQVLSFMALSFICTIVSWVKLRPAASMWLTANLLLLTSISWPTSFPRFTLVMYPIYIIFAQLAVNRFWNGVIVVWSLLNLGFFISLFVRGNWAF